MIWVSDRVVVLCAAHELHGVGTRVFGDFQESPEESYSTAGGFGSIQLSIDRNRRVREIHNSVLSRVTNLLRERACQCVFQGLNQTAGVKVRHPTEV